MSLYDHETWFMMTTLMHQARKVWTLSCLAECDRIPKQRLFLFPICDVIVRKFIISHSCTINTFCTCVPVKTCLISIQRPTSHSVEAPGMGGPLLYASDDHECLGLCETSPGAQRKRFLSNHKPKADSVHKTWKWNSDPRVRKPVLLKRPYILILGGFIEVT